MTTQRESALKNIITPEMKKAAQREGVSPELIMRGLKKGTIALVKNKNRRIPAVAIGRGMSTKVNANIGTSKLASDLTSEIDKLKICEKYGADAVMDLSTGGELDQIRKELLKNTKLCFGTVPIYQVMCEQNGNISGESILKVIETQCAQGVDFITVHCGITKKVVAALNKKQRVMGVVSRGGSFLTKWIKKTGQENPFYEYFDEICDIAYKYDVTLSLGDGMRPGCLADAHDQAQILELKILGQLTKRAWRKNVQVIIEGPGHVPYNEIAYSMKLEKRLCHNAPFYVLGPLTTDVAPGYDHITSAIGGTLAAVAGADFLCYVTPTEHLGLPDAEDVRTGIIASRIAAHSADIVKYPARAKLWDLEMAKARKAFDWKKQIELAIDSDKAQEIRKLKGNSDELQECTMCGDLCSMKDS